MAIIINEFEIVPPPDGATNGDSDRSSGRATPSPATAAAYQLQPGDIEEIMRRSLQRRLRVWAD